MAAKLKIDKVKIERPEIGAFERPAKIVRPPRGMQWPNFESFFTPEENPLDGFDPTFDVEQDAELIMGIVRETFDDDEAGGDEAWVDEYRIANDSEFFLVVCFQSREQKEEFLGKARWAELGDKYLDGLEVAKHMGLDVAPIPLPKKPPRKMPVGLRDFKIIE